MNNVLTPFSRYYNLIELGNAVKETGAHWHLLSVEGEHKFPDLGTWVSQHHFKPPPPNFWMGHHLINEFIESGEVKDEDRYLVLTDDDFLERDLFAKLDKYDDDVLIVSMKRSNVPTSGNGECAFNTLVACPENLRHGSVGFEQLCIRGKLMKKYRVPGIYHGDFLFIEQVWNNHMESFRFVPDAYVEFNRLPPGRAGRWDR
jgi:hypothetical protein